MLAMQAVATKVEEQMSNSLNAGIGAMLHLATGAHQFVAGMLPANPLKKDAPDSNEGFAPGEHFRFRKREISVSSYALTQSQCHKTMAGPGLQCSFLGSRSNIYNMAKAQHQPVSSDTALYCLHAGQKRNVHANPSLQDDSDDDDLVPLGDLNAPPVEFVPRPKAGSQEAGNTHVLRSASQAFQEVTKEALQEHKTVAGESKAPSTLCRAFSICEKDDCAVDLSHLTTLQKVACSALIVFQR